LAEQILNLLEEDELTSRELSERLTFTETNVLGVLQVLLDSKKIGLNLRNKYFRI
jgi:ATP-dependent DNA helicase RecQ